MHEIRKNQTCDEIILEPLRCIRILVRVFVSRILNDNVNQLCVCVCVVVMYILFYAWCFVLEPSQAIDV